MDNKIKKASKIFLDVILVPEVFKNKSINDKKLLLV